MECDEQKHNDDGKFINKEDKQQFGHCQAVASAAQMPQGATEELLQNIHEKSSNILSKLKEKRLNLQNKVNDGSVAGNSDSISRQVLKAMKTTKVAASVSESKSHNTCTIETKSSSQQTCNNTSKHVPHSNGAVPKVMVKTPTVGNKIQKKKTATTNIVESNDSTPIFTPDYLDRHSKTDLKSLVEGLQLLITNLTVNDNNLQKKVKKLAGDIDVLKEFPLFATIGNNNRPSMSVKSTNRSSMNCEKIDERPVKKNNEEQPCTNERAENSTSRKKEKQEQKSKKCEVSSPREVFLNYINSSLSEFTGEDKNATKVVCTSANLDDLENFSHLLVQMGFGSIIEGEIRVNRKNNRQAFISMSNDRETVERDAIVTVPAARHFAFDGDIVRAFVFNTKSNLAKFGCVENGRTRTESVNIMGGKDNSICLTEDEDPLAECDSSPDTDVEEDNATAILPDNCRKAFVISIVKQTELREVVGSINFIKTTTLNSKVYYKLKPHDMRIPMVYIPADSCQDHVDAASQDDVVGMLFLALILETDINGNCIGELLQPVGKVGNLEAEIKAILLHNGLKNLKPYDQKFYDMYDGPMPPITEEDLKYREDLRKKCVFTIDPLTARDLDDAMSVEKISEEEYEIGVHISDVSHYLEEGSELDNLVKERATSIYLVNEVIHMLPTSLCFRCSLLPGEDKFAFSVFWHWNVAHQTLSEPRFTRTVINSCSQFAYEHAQMIIDNPDEEFTNSDLPDIFNGFTTNDIKWRILLLHSISQHLKTKRYESGALSINNPKLRFNLDPITGEPLSYEIEGRKEANYLIEEFMLLANQAVAKFTHEHFPNAAILRSHAPPLQKSMRALKDRLENLDLEFDISTSKTVYESMKRLSQTSEDPTAIEACLNTFLTKPMARARYYCSEGKSAEADFWHYALSIPIYTHFTSPIRRYPDILVHRTLAASLNYCPPPKRTAEELHELTKICNEQKFNAKNAGDESIDLFFHRYIRSKESITLKAAVTDIFKHMLNVVSIETGHTFTINYKQQKVIIDATHAPKYVLVSEKNSQLPPVKLQIFSTVDIRVVLRDNKKCAFIISPDKTQRRLNSKESSKLRDKNVLNTTANGVQNNSILTSEGSSKKKTNRKRRVTTQKKMILSLLQCHALARPQFFPQQFPGIGNNRNPFFPTNNNNQGNIGNNINQGNIGVNNGISSTTVAPNTPTTASPQYLLCLQSCPSTMEYNPICGSDNINYHNNGRLVCAQRCGKTFLLNCAFAFPDSRNPNLEYEIINPSAPQLNDKPALNPIPTTPHPVIINTPPTPPKDSKNFVYNPVTKTWTELKKNDPPPAEDALIWNQSNDIWLTMVARI
ncbi:DIS3-like exonuclease 2 [Musca vetustissima]|uniref:DIS3-like exonuclease 2 n=1 Tax=Musca vetustissima TaxID=27455 RepID=UPI002AB793AE|nr:DIS3-like exonuclease 2 [Musca vetustissima]